MYGIAKVAVENAAPGFDKLYSYFIPPELRETALPGCRVTVPFGRGNRRRTGLLLETETAAERDEGLKPLLAVLDFPPLLGEEGLELLRYLQEHTFCMWFDALRLLIPPGVGLTRQVVYSPGEKAPLGPLTPLQREILAFAAARRGPVEEKELCAALPVSPQSAELASLVERGLLRRGEQIRQRIRDEKMTMVQPCEDWVPVSLSPKQKKALAFLEEVGSASLKEVCYYAAVTRAVTDALRRKGAVEYYEQVVPRNPYRDREAGGAPPEVRLTPQQQAAFDSLAGALVEEKPKPALLYGVTGSGKTQVFLRLIREALRRGRRAIVLMPEISLTAQALQGFHEQFGGRVAVLHSALSLGERTDEWKRIRDGGADVVVGTRSAVFAPLPDIGLIVVDEEQEHTYKSDKSPRYHARDVARWRCARHGALLLLASATPSVESYYAAGQGRFRLVSLDERYGGARLPDVYVVDMKEPGNLSASPSISARLLDELHFNLSRGEQSILLLNRRGYSTVVKCSSCGAAAECPHCSVALTYHTANESLICHYCGYTAGRATSCGHCGSRFIRYAGAGTQKLEEELGSLFPDARILRVDMDTTLTRFAHERLFGAFAAGEYDIMVGTQMVSKGLNFPRVTLVGVICADQSLYSSDFRSFERSFSLLTQVVGRSGRGEQSGRAVVQTYSPENPVIQLAAEQDYPSFFRQELLSRRLHLYPPFCTMAGIGFVGEQEQEVLRWSENFLDEFRRLAGAEYPELPVRVLGPSPADLFKAAGKYRYKLILKCKNSPKTRQLLGRMLDWFYKKCKTVRIFVDMQYDGI